MSFLSKEGDLLSEAIPVRGCFAPVVTKAPASPSDIVYDILVTEVVYQILDDILPHVHVLTLNNIIQKLKEMLLEEIAGFDIPVKSNHLHIPSILE